MQTGLHMVNVKWYDISLKFTVNTRMPDTKLTRLLRNMKV
jgi:hypothetical protein